MERNMSMGADIIDWGDGSFSSSEFPDSITAESSWGRSALDDFTNLADYSDSPAALGVRTPSKSGPGAAAGAQNLPLSHAAAPSASNESSSQDSASDSSSRRKRKTTSESPLSDPVMDTVRPVLAEQKEGSAMQMDEYQTMENYERTFGQPMPGLSVEHRVSDSTDPMFDFHNSPSSPTLHRDFNQQLSLDAKMTLPTTTSGSSFKQKPFKQEPFKQEPFKQEPFEQESPVQTINPGMVTVGGSRDQSPVTTNNMMFNTASPTAIFSTPSSDSTETFNPSWNTTMTQNPSWPADFSSQFASPGGLGFTPSPVANGAPPQLVSRGLVANDGRSPLHIAPISAKSRVETQINVVMTLEKPPPRVEQLHLPLHTIAKSKLLSKEDIDMSTVLELHTMLVCSSAMHNPSLKEKALRNAAAQNNHDIQQRAEQPREVGEEDRNDPKNIPEESKPVNGGEVRICPNCIQRERKRAGRKKLKKEEEQQHWERYETERVVVFNSNEYLPFKPFEQTPQPQRDSGIGKEEQYSPPEGAVSVAAAMRIACYCRHQNEKEGFQVIFTLKDQHGNVVAQQFSDSILITDDHKTHPAPLSAMSSDSFYRAPQVSSTRLPTSYSLVDLSAHQQSFPSSRSAGNLQALAYGQQYNPHSHIHQVPQGPQGSFTSQATSATMTPTSLSRPGSPTSAGQAGPNKKRKSSSFGVHRRVPSGLQMTPRVDTSQPPSSNLPSATSGTITNAFSPTLPTGFPQNEGAYMTIPNNNGSAQFFGSAPPTPGNDAQQFSFPASHQVDITRAQNASAYFSHPSSAVPSRSNSPVLQQNRLNMAAYVRQQPIQTPTNSIHRAAPQPVFTAQVAPGSQQSENQSTTPMITKITPNEGPVSGGTEVSVFGYNFTHGTQIAFGDRVAPTTFYGTQSILATSPPGRSGAVRVSLVTLQGQPIFNSPSSNQPVFTYKDAMNPQMMEMALRFLSQQQTGDAGRWMQYTNEVANQFMQTSISPAGIQSQGFSGGGNMLATGPADMEDMVLKILDLADVGESARVPCFDSPCENGQTMLSVACSMGLHRVAAALLVRGANPDARDKGGYTPLMHAAVHGHQATFQLLLNRGADPAIRSLKGYSAIELVPADAKQAFRMISQCTQRRRARRPSVYDRFARVSFGSSSTTSKASWDISSASFYESEVDDSENDVSKPTSRRPSATISLPPTPEEQVRHDETANVVPNHVAPSAATVAWRDAITAQIHNFQQHVHSSMSHFQLPALPHAPECRDSTMVRRLSLLASSSWDMFYSPSPAEGTPPPAYSELFPGQAGGLVAEKDATGVTSSDGTADENRVKSFEEPSKGSWRAPEWPCRHVKSPNSAENAAVPSWFWIPSLVFTTSMVMHAVMPYISTIPTWASGVLGEQQIRVS